MSIEFGKIGEDKAARFLESRGYEILDRNFRCKLGEIDIVARDASRDCIVFVEVKTRKNLKYGRPCEAVTEYKKRHLRRCALFYMQKNGMQGRNCRIDVVELLINESGSYINHLKNCI